LSDADREKVKDAILTRAERTMKVAISLTQPVRAKMAKSLKPKMTGPDTASTD
jgi:hypothetical protein